MILAESSGSGYMIQLLKEIHIFGTTVYITSTHVCTFIVSIFLIILALVINRKVKKLEVDDTPGTLVVLAETLVEFLDNMTKGLMGNNAKRFVNYVSTLFVFVLLCNISGIFGLRAPTADYEVTLPLGLITFVMVQYNGIKKNKFKHFTDMCKPAVLTPINIIGELAVPLSLSIRLFGNVMSGTVLMGLIYGLLPRLVTIGIPAFLHIYFDLFSGVIQAYVICMLTMVYVNDKIAD